MGFSAFVCADWSKDVDKRVAYVAEVATRRIRLLSATPTFAGMLAAARVVAPLGSVLLGFDVPLGVPCSLLSRRHSMFSATTFRELLQERGCDPAFFHESKDATCWSPKRPFFAVPRGDGSLSAFSQAAQRYGINLKREIEILTGGKSLFITRGIPGSVGSSVVSLWREIAEAANQRQTFALWPFDGSLGDLSSGPGVVVGEIYPRAAYATVFIDGFTKCRPQMSVAKTLEHVRGAALRQLNEMSWIAQHQVVLEGMDAARRSEDHFDALITAAALLRCELEALPLHCPLTNPRVEGGILATGSVNLRLPAKRFAAHNGVLRTPDHLQGQLVSALGARSYACPIQNCAKVFAGSRGGWDRHVGTLARHPDWHPMVTDETSRKRKFRAEFPSFFK